MELHSGGPHGSPTPEPGLAIGAYLLVRRERSTDDEQVWLGRTVASPPTAVTIRLRPAAATSPFGHEVQLGPWLAHPNVFAATEQVVVGTWHCAIAAGSPATPLPELLAGLSNLRAHDEHQWTAVVLHILAALLSGLDAAHGTTGAPDHPKGIVHGTIRPALVQLGVDGSVRLGGFGAVVDDDPSRIADRSVDALVYAAPEQFGSRGRAPSMDLWALGAVLHELVEGTRFRGELTDVRVLYRAAVAGEVPALTRAAPEPIERMRTWLLATQPRDRPRSCADALAALPASTPAVAAWLGGLVRAQQGPPVALDAAAHGDPRTPGPAAAPAFAPVPMPAPMSMPPPMSMPSMPAPMSMPSPAPVPNASPARVPPMVTPPPGGFVIPENEGTVQLDEAVLAAMRAGTAPPASARGGDPPRSSPSELMMPPPAARSSSRSAAPPSRNPAPVAQPRPPGPVGPPPSHAPVPLARPVVAQPHGPGPQPRHDPGPLELQPSYEPTTTTTLRARRSNRNFVILLVAAAAVAIGVGVTVGYLIVGDAPPPGKAAPKAKDPPPQPAEAAPPTNDGPVLAPTPK